MVGISISVRLSANQQALYNFACNALTKHNSDKNMSISIRLTLMLMSYPSSLAHKRLLFMPMSMLASQVKTAVKHKVEREWEGVT